MAEMLKSVTFLVFGVLLSPLCLGMLVPLVLYDLTQHQVAIIVGTAFYLVIWALAWGEMKLRKWHYYL